MRVRNECRTRMLAQRVKGRVDGDQKGEATGVASPLTLVGGGSPRTAEPGTNGYERDEPSPEQQQASGLWHGRGGGKRAPRRFDNIRVEPEKTERRVPLLAEIAADTSRTSYRADRSEMVAGQ